MQNEHIKFYGITFDPDEAVAVTTTEDDHVAILSMGEEHGGTKHKIQRGHKRGSGASRLPSESMLAGNGSVGQTSQGSFSAVSKPNFASKYAFESSRRDLQNALLCTDL